MKTFKEEYETQIEPYLKQIDIFLKTKKLTIFPIITFYIRCLKEHNTIANAIKKHFKNECK